MKTKTKISKQTKKKKNPELVETIIFAKKNKEWLEVAGILSGPRKLRVNINLEDINKKSEEKDIVVIPGKVLSQGEINKKIKITALGFSENASKKLKEAGIEYSLIKEEIKKNPDAKGIKIIK